MGLMGQSWRQAEQSGGSCRNPGADHDFKEKSRGENGEVTGSSPSTSLHLHHQHPPEFHLYHVPPGRPQRPALLCPRHISCHLRPHQVLSGYQDFLYSTNPNSSPGFKQHGDRNGIFFLMLNVQCLAGTWVLGV